MLISASILMFDRRMPNAFLFHLCLMWSSQLGFAVFPVPNLNLIPAKTHAMITIVICKFVLAICLLSESLTYGFFLTGLE